MTEEALLNEDEGFQWGILGKVLTKKPLQNLAFKAAMI